MGKRLLWLALLLTVAAALWPVAQNDPREDTAGRPSAARNQASSTFNAGLPPQLGALTASDPAREAQIGDLFARHSWTALAVSAAPETPTAPALPFTYGGRYTEGDKIFVFLNEGAKMHTVRQGDTVNATYRVENIAPGTITLTYLPLGLQQILQTGSTILPP